MLRVQSIPFENDVGRCGLNKVLSRSHEQGRILTPASGAANIGLQGACQLSAGKGVEACRSKLSVSREDKALPPKRLNRIKEWFLTNEVARALSEPSLTTNHGDEGGNEHLRAIRGMFQCPAQYGPYPFRLTDYLPLRLWVAGSQAGSTDLKLNVGVAWFPRFCLGVVHKAGKCDDYRVGNGRPRSIVLCGHFVLPVSFGT